MTILLVLALIFFSVEGWGQITQVTGSPQTSTTTTTTLTITKPSGLAVGDMMLLQVVQSGDGAANSITDIAPSGWTQIAGSYIENVNNTTVVRATLLYKVATAPDVAAANFSFTLDSDSDDGEGGIVAFSGVDGTTPFDVTPGTVYTGISDDNNFTASAITTTTANSAIIMFGAISDNNTISNWSTTNPGTLTELYDVPFDATEDIGMGAAWALKPAIGSTGTGTADINATDPQGAILIALRPAPMQTFTSNSTFTVPAGVTSITVELWGGGGRGGSRTSGDNFGCGGGGGGAYARSVLSVTPGQVYDVFVGAGSTSTAAGGDSRFRLQPAGPDLVRATGGNTPGNNSTTGATGGSAGTSLGDVTRVGGNGANGFFGTGTDYGGGGGSAAGTSANGTSATNQNGAVAPAGGGDGGNGFSSTNTTGSGSPGLTPGGGGGGALRYSSGGSPTGGNGASGQVIVTWIVCSTITTTAGSNSPICAGATLNLTATNATGGTGPYTYNWSGPGGYLATNTQNPSRTNATTAMSGTYTVTATDANNCTGTSSVTVAVNPLPTVFNVTGGGAYCAGGVGVAVGLSGSTMSVNYQLRLAGVDTGSPVAGTGAAISFGNQTAAGTYTVVATDATTNCTATMTGSVVVTVNANPTASISGTLSFCAGGSTTLTASGGTSYLWDDASTNDIRTITAAGSYTVEVTDANGCTDTETVMVTANTPATADAGGPYSTCGATPVAISATASGPGMWSGGLGSFASASSTNTTYTAAPSEFGTTVTLTWTTNDPDGAGGCIAVNDDASLAVSGQEIDVKGNGNAIANGDVTPASSDLTDFGWTTVASGTITRSFTIQNSGSSSLTLTGGTPVTLSGPHMSDFTVTMQPASPLSPMGMTMFEITFDPSAAGMRNATVSIANNDCDEAPYTFDITGKGTIPQAISVFGNGNPIANRAAAASVSDDTDFGSVSTGGGMVSRTFTIYNVANGSPLSLTGGAKVTIADRDAADFMVTTQPASPIDGGGSTTFTIKFQPGATGLRTAIVIITHDDLPENPFVFTINGTGL